MTEGGTVKPLLVITQGDPCGIGPEVVAKALSTGAAHDVCRPVVVGSVASMEAGARIAGVGLKVRKVDRVEAGGEDRAAIDVLDEGALDPEHITLGRAVAECGRANGAWLSRAAELCQGGAANGTVMAPVNGEALVRGGAADQVLGTDETARYLTLLSGPLRVVHLFDHVALADVCQRISADLVQRAVERTHAALSEWGIAEPRIAVAGLNPHAHGRQESEEIAPGVERAREAGLRVSGPIAPDTVFRHCIEGRYDVVIAMFHDQGHIAVKTWGFEGNCALFLGAPYLFLSVGHGTAFDIVGRGVANPAMLLSAILQGASLASGQGFLTAPA